MSLIVSTKKEKKVNKTDDKNCYYKEYRQNNLDHIRNLDKLKYYKKKYNLEPEFVDLFGEYSGDVFKILKAYNDLASKCPELKTHIIERLKEKNETIEIQ